MWMLRMVVMMFAIHYSLFTSAEGDDVQMMFNPVEHAVISQTIAPDARGAGMGDVGVATDPDVTSQYWNPAKYPFCISRAGVALNYTPWLRKLVGDIDLAYLSGYYRIGDYSALSGSLRYFSLGEVYTYDGSDMTVKPYEMSFDVAYSMMLSEKFSLAAAIRWIYSDLRYDYSEDSKPASAFAADLAMYYNNYIMLGSRECQLGLGMNISNVGSKISFFGDAAIESIQLNGELSDEFDLSVFNFPFLTLSRGRDMIKKMDPKECIICHIPFEYDDVNGYRDSVSKVYDKHDLPPPPMHIMERELQKEELFRE